jgi:hypothetical protein
VCEELTVGSKKQLSQKNGLDENQVHILIISYQTVEVVPGDVFVVTSPVLLS